MVSDPRDCRNGVRSVGPVELYCPRRMTAGRSDQQGTAGHEFGIGLCDLGARVPDRDPLKLLAPRIYAKATVPKVPRGLVS